MSGEHTCTHTKPDVEVVLDRTATPHGGLQQMEELEGHHAAHPAAIDAQDADAGRRWLEYHLQTRWRTADRACPQYVAVFLLALSFSKPRYA